MIIDDAIVVSVLLVDTDANDPDTLLISSGQYTGGFNQARET